MMMTTLSPNGFSFEMGVSVFSFALRILPGMKTRFIKVMDGERVMQVLGSGRTPNCSVELRTDNL